MADGDAAAAAGMDTVAGTDDLRDSYNQHNKTRDYLAQHQTSGTHSASQIASGVLDAARIPTLPGSRISGPVALTGTSAFDAINIGGAPASINAAGDANLRDIIASALSASGLITFPDVYTRSVAGGGGFRTVSCRADGVMGFASSTRRAKKNIKKLAPAPLTRLLEADVVEFDYKAGGHDVGLIAEDLDALGLGAFVAYDADGRPDGINYDRLVVPLLAIVQTLARRIDELEQKNGDR
jgi:hypothetical protein